MKLFCQWLRGDRCDNYPSLSFPQIQRITTWANLDLISLFSLGKSHVLQLFRSVDAFSYDFVNTEDRTLTGLRVMTSRASVTSIEERFREGNEDPQGHFIDS